MTWIASNLWDLLNPARRQGGRSMSQAARERCKPSRNGAARAQAAIETKPDSMQARYDALVSEMKRAYGIRVRKWRKSSSGVAREIRYRDGRLVKLIESPYPKGPISCAIFLHEVGHHAIGLGVLRPRCLEEFRVWQWALERMREREFSITPAVEQRVKRSMRYAVAKAMRRGIQDLPEELLQFL